MEWSEVAARRRKPSRAILATAAPRRTRKHRPRSDEERDMLLRGVRAEWRRRVASGDLEWTGSRELSVRIRSGGVRRMLGKTDIELTLDDLERIRESRS